MRNPLLVPELRELLSSGKAEELADFCENSHPATVAEFIAALEAGEVRQLLWAVEPRTRALIFGHLDLDAQVDLAETLGRQELADVVTHMSHDERVDLLQGLPEERREKLLPALAQAEREDIRRLIAYEEGTAGSVMTSDYATLSPGLTASEAIERLRREAPDKETIYVAYVLDEGRRLVGTVSLRQLMLAPSRQTVAEIMQQELIFARADEDRETMAQTIAKYDLLALPIVNAAGELVGIVTHDDAIDVIQEEMTEDIEVAAGIAGPHEVASYLRTPIGTHFRHRVVWVVVLLALQMLAALIIQSYEGALDKLLVLAVYIPMIANVGGNTGSQTASLIVRGLALGDVARGDAARVILKEFGVSAMLAAVLGALAFGEVLLLSAGADMGSHALNTVAAAIGIALAAQVVTSMLIGAALPLVVDRAGLDPAIVASPALTTLVDITGLLIYFGTATVVLGL